MAASMKEIAELVGVSESTVSRALNNSSLISEKTRNQVFEAARKLHYKPPRSKLVGVIQPNITNPVYSQIIEEIEERLYDADYGLMLYNSLFDIDREQTQVDFLLGQGGIQGMILIPIDPEAEHIKKINTQDIPCVILGTDLIPGSDQVNFNAALGASLVTRHLIELGHRHIGLLLGPSQISACRERLKGFCQALSEHRIPFETGLVAEGEVDECGGAEAMRKLLPKSGSEMTAVLAVSDVMAMGAIRLLREEGIHVPEDLSLAGCDDIPAAALIQPALTTVWQPKGELGSLSVKFLLQQVESRKAQGVNWKNTYPFQSAVFHPHLVIRESTKELLR